MMDEMLAKYSRDGICDRLSFRGKSYDLPSDWSGLIPFVDFSQRSVFNIESQEFNLRNIPMYVIPANAGKIRKKIIRRGHTNIMDLTDQIVRIYRDSIRFQHKQVRVGHTFYSFMEFKSIIKNINIHIGGRCIDLFQEFMRVTRIMGLREPAIPHRSFERFADTVVKTNTDRYALECYNVYSHWALSRGVDMTTFPSEEEFLQY